MSRRILLSSALTFFFSVLTLKIPHKLSPEFLELNRKIYCVFAFHYCELETYNLTSAERVLSYSWTVLSKEGNELDCSSLTMCRNRNAGGSSTLCKIDINPSTWVVVQRFLKAFAIQLLGVANLKVEILYKLRMKEMHHRRANRFILVKQVFFYWKVIKDFKYWGKLR